MCIKKAHHTHHSSPSAALQATRHLGPHQPGTHPAAYTTTANHGRPALLNPTPQRSAGRARHTPRGAPACIPHRQCNSPAGRRPCPPAFAAARRCEGRLLQPLQRRWQRRWQLALVSAWQPAEGIGTQLAITWFLNTFYSYLPEISILHSHGISRQRPCKKQHAHDASCHTFVHLCRTVEVAHIGCNHHKHITSTLLLSMGLQHTPQPSCSIVQLDIRCARKAQAQVRAPEGRV